MNPRHTVLETVALPAELYPYMFAIKRPLLRANGGDKRDRTADLLNAIQALSQLSYTPMTLTIIAQTEINVKKNFFFFLKNKKRLTKMGIWQYNKAKNEG